MIRAPPCAPIAACTWTRACSRRPNDPPLRVPEPVAQPRALAGHAGGRRLAPVPRQLPRVDHRRAGDVDREGHQPPAPDRAAPNLADVQPAGGVLGTLAPGAACHGGLAVE